MFATKVALGGEKNGRVVLRRPMRDTRGQNVLDMKNF